MYHFLREYRALLGEYLGSFECIQRSFDVSLSPFASLLLSEYMYMYVHIYIYKDIYMYTHIYTYINIYIYI